MVTTWMGYCLLISGLFTLAALAAERGLGHYEKPVRWVWVGAIVGSILVPVAAFLAPALFPAPLTPAELPVTLTMGPMPDIAPLATTASGIDPATVSAILGWAWGLSVALICLHLGRTYRRLRSEMREWTPGTILDSPVLLSSDRGPAVVGVRRAVIVMPRWISELEEGLLRLVFLHEREHQRAGDHRLYALGISALVSMPWNVILWWQVARLRLAIEFDCDRRVLESGVARRDYAEALLAVGGRVSGPLLAAAAFAERKPAVERRLRRMTEPVARLRAPRTLGATGLAALAIILVLGAPPPAGLEMWSRDMPVPVDVSEADGIPDGAEPYRPLPPVPPADASRPSFIPYDTPPVMRNRDEVVQAITAAYPRELQEAGIGGRVEVWLYIDENGNVENHLTKTSSGHDRLDAAAEAVAPTMRFKPAVNRNKPTPVWVSQFITFTSVDASTQADGVEGDPLIVIDGVIQTGSTKLSDLEALEIDHVEIVKGDEAIRLYGDRAKDGAVHITTKEKAEQDSRQPPPAEPSSSDDATFDLGFGDFDDDGLLDVWVGPKIINAWTPRDALTGGDAPLVLIDGVVQSKATLASEGLTGLLSPDDIDHVRLSQGLAAERRFGDRGKNGVIEITTKPSR